jgi:hypothetical protein
VPPPVPLPDVLVPLVEIPPAPANAPPAPDVLALVELPEVLAVLLVLVVVLDVAPEPWPPESATPAQPRAWNESRVAQDRRPEDVITRPIFVALQFSMRGGIQKWRKAP